jgi:hypothetical protein
VTVNVRLTWTFVDDTGHTGFYSGEAYPWTFHTVRGGTVRGGGGWTVCGYEGPDPCATYVRC